MAEKKRLGRPFGSVSAEIIKARKLLREGVHPAEAARQAGVSRSALSIDAECKEIRRMLAEKGALPNPFESSKMKEALRLLDENPAMFVSEAAQKVGLSRSTVYGYMYANGITRRAGRGELALNLVLSDGLSVAEAARRVGVSRRAVYHAKNKLRGDKAP